MQDGARRLSRRGLLREALRVAGGVASSATLVGTLGCGPVAPPAASTRPARSATATRPAASPGVAGTRSPLAVAADAPAIEAQDLVFQTNGATLMAYQARPRGATGPLPLVLVCHENRGLVEHVRDVARVSPSTAAIWAARWSC